MVGTQWVYQHHSFDGLKTFKADEGLKQNVEKLSIYLENNSDLMNHRPIILERLFNAPTSKVWAALTDKNEMKKWYFDLAEFKGRQYFKKF
jgi:hypothetical protein